MDVVNECEFSVDELTKVTLKCLKLRGVRIWLFISITLLSIGFGFVALFLALHNKKNISDAILILVCLFIILFMLLYFVFIYPKSIKKNYAKNFLNGIKYKYTFHINRVDLESEVYNGNTRATFNYDNLIKVVEDNNYLLLYIAKRNFLPVKKEAFIENEFIKIKKAIKNSKTKYIEKIKNNEKKN